MVLDQTANFIRGNTSSSIDGSQTTIPVDDSSIFPDPSDGEYNVVVWDVENYPRPDQDDDVEIMRVTGRDTSNDELTVDRGQENTSATSHPSDSAMHLSPTAKMFGDIEDRYVADGEDFDGQGDSSFDNLKSVTTEDLNIDVGTDTGTTHPVFEILSGANTDPTDGYQRTRDVSTSAKTIYTQSDDSNNVSLVLVKGRDVDGGDRFFDVVMFCRRSSNNNTIGSLDVDGSPSGRSYSSGLDDPDLFLEVDSGSYNVGARGLEVSN